jgi:hypothetical protein
MAGDSLLQLVSGDLSSQALTGKTTDIPGISDICREYPQNQ